MIGHDHQDLAGAGGGFLDQGRGVRRGGLRDWHGHGDQNGFVENGHGQHLLHDSTSRHFAFRTNTIGIEMRAKPHAKIKASFNVNRLLPA
ncbi:hypothetical protein [Chromobacterium piscinae]|uniref:hypothetical protein n=1 Tax=Chromobacterium piscinae TaxID=686831 RepID=UPI0031FD19AC